MDSHGHGPIHGYDHKAKHEPHVLPLSTYFKTWGALLVLTGLTVAASYVDFGGANIFIALGIATVKASIVAAVFMHLFWDHKFHTIIFAMSVVFTGIFVAFTMFDTETRGRMDPQKGDRPVDITQPFAESRHEQAIKERFAPPPAEPAEHAEHGGAHH